ncbi:lycopene cyclase family protein [Candidatus Pelagibacter sp.]|uniref:lycopene cyclase family protein n=1 Tax=Candidatus Pelagibacter sp. TaxID=2024849 RepID=UPI003F87D30D
MKEFDYIIKGAGCAGLSLAYELNEFKKLKDKTLAIIEPRESYNRDKTWSFWKTIDHNFDDCVIKNWSNFTINVKGKTHYLNCNETPYQTINSGIFYKKIISNLKSNPNIQFFKNINEINSEKSLIFNSVPRQGEFNNKLWQHFFGIEIETSKKIFDDKIFNLMDFDCDQRDNVHFFYTLPYAENKALIETTWLSNLNNKGLQDYESQVLEYLEHKLKIKNYKITFKEKGAIPLFKQPEMNNNEINIGTAGGMTRLSTGYTFLNIQEHSKYIRENLDVIKNKKKFDIGKKYHFLDEIFIRVLENNPNLMPNIFYKMFEVQTKKIINFLSNKSNWLEDLSVIMKMPKLIFIKALFK